jgi:hypothetical protein
VSERARGRKMGREWGGSEDILDTNYIIIFLYDYSDKN